LQWADVQQRQQQRPHHSGADDRHICVAVRAEQQQQQQQQQQQGKAAPIFACGAFWVSTPVLAGMGLAATVQFKVSMRTVWPAYAVRLMFLPVCHTQVAATWTAVLTAPL
jgi:hypothetical protein